MPGGPDANQPRMARADSASDALRRLIARWREDAGGPYNTWFLSVEAIARAHVTLNQAVRCTFDRRSHGHQFVRSVSRHRLRQARA